MGTAVDVERVRVGAERTAGAAIGYLFTGSPPFEVQDTAAARRALQRTALLLTEPMAPAAHEAARVAMDRLGVTGAVELYQSTQGATDTVRLALYSQPIGVEFIGGYLASLDDGGLLAVIGHEIGHSIAHMTHTASARLFAESQRARTPEHRAYAQAAEMTADRFGLLACRDIEAVLRVEMCAAAGRSAPSLRLDTRSYLETCRAIAEDTLAHGGIAAGNTHPEHYIRGYAEWLFSETDLYASITGVGPGTRSIDAVDEVLARLLGVARRPPEPFSIGVPATRASGGGAEGGEPEGVADLLTDGARRTIEGTAKVIGDAAEAAMPTVRRVAGAVRARLGLPRRKGEHAPPSEESDLLARFKAFEKKLP